MLGARASGRRSLVKFVQRVVPPLDFGLRIVRAVSRRRRAPQVPLLELLDQRVRQLLDVYRSAPLPRPRGSTARPPVAPTPAQSLGSLGDLYIAPLRRFSQVKKKLHPN